MKINRYIGNTGRVVHVKDTPQPVRHTGYRTRYSPSPQPVTRETGSVAGNVKKQVKKPPSGTPAGGFGFESISGTLKSMLPKNTEFGDILILAVFLFLYIESRDTDFLIILTVLVLSIFKDSQLLSGLSGISSLL